MRSRQQFTLRFFPILCCLIVVIFVACGEGSSRMSSSTHPKAADSLQIFVQPLPVTDITSFDPALSPDSYSIQAIDAVFTGLVGFDDKLNVTPELAQSWEESPDGMKWTFHLRSHLRFSDGTPLTSKDVAYSIDRSLQPTVKSTTAPIYEALIQDADKLNAGKIKTIINDSILTPDLQTVIIKTTKNASYFLQTLVYPSSYVIEKSLVERYGNAKFTDSLTEGGGDGPWKVLEYNHSTGITLVPNPFYHGSKPMLRKMVFTFYKDVDTAYTAYQVGQLDTTGSETIPASNFEQAHMKSREYVQVPGLGIGYLSMNYLVKPFDNIHIRQAFALALNKDVLVSKVLKGSSIATNHIVPQGMPGYYQNLKGPVGVVGTAGDANKARQLLQMGMQEEGWNIISQIPSIRLTYIGGSKTLDNLVAAEQQMWQSVLGITVTLDTVELGQLLHELTAAINNPQGLQMWFLGWGADYPDPQDFLTLQFDRGVPNNNMNYGQNSASDAAQQQAIQRLMEQADINSDQQARLQQYNQAEQQLVDDVAWLPIMQGFNSMLIKPCVRGYVINGELEVPPQDWANIYISTDMPCANAKV